MSGIELENRLRDLRAKRNLTQAELAEIGTQMREELSQPLSRPRQRGERAQRAQTVEPVHGHAGLGLLDAEVAGLAHHDVHLPAS